MCSNRKNAWSLLELCGKQNWKRKINSADSSNDYFNNHCSQIFTGLFKGNIVSALYSVFASSFGEDDNHSI